MRLLLESCTECVQDAPRYPGTTRLSIQAMATLSATDGFLNPKPLQVCPWQGWLKQDKRTAPEGSFSPLWLGRVCRHGLR